MISWVQEIAGWAPIAYAGLVTTAVGTTIYFFPIARLLDSLAEWAQGRQPVSRLASKSAAGRRTTFNNELRISMLPL
jgi:hypothetical protein